MATMRASIETIWALLCQVTPISTGHISQLVEDETNNNDPIKSQVHKVFSDLDNDDEDEYNQDSF